MFLVDNKLLELMREHRGVSNAIVERYMIKYPNILNKRDLYQLSLISMYNSILKYDENRGSSFVTFYSVIFEREILMHLRSISSDKSRANLNAISLDRCIAETDGIYLIDSLENTHDYFEPAKCSDISLFYEVIDKAISEFSERDQNIFRMWMHGYTYLEIGEVHQLNKKAVEYVIRKIRIHIRPSLKQWL